MHRLIDRLTPDQLGEVRAHAFALGRVDDIVAQDSYWATTSEQQPQPRKRLADLLIAAVASAHRLPLVTRNPDDFAGLDKHVAVISV